jgi:hypothetical protein
MKNFKVDLRLMNNFITDERFLIRLFFFVSLEARKKDKGGGYLLMSALMMGKCFYFKFRVRLTWKSVAWKKNVKIFRKPLPNVKISNSLKFKAHIRHFPLNQAK